MGRVKRHLSDVQLSRLSSSMERGCDMFGDALNQSFL